MPTAAAEWISLRTGAECGRAGPDGNTFPPSALLPIHPYSRWVPPPARSRLTRTAPASQRAWTPETRPVPLLSSEALVVRRRFEKHLRSLSHGPSLPPHSVFHQR